MMDIAVLRAAGLSDEQILAVLEAEQKQRREKTRAVNRDRQRRWRARNDVTRDERDERDERDPPQAYTTPPKEIKPKKVLSAKHALPADFELSESDNRSAIAAGWDSQKIASELQRFRDHAAANGRKQADWHAAWRNWVTSPYQQSNGNGAHGHEPKKPSVSDVLRRMCDDVRERESSDSDGVLPQIGRR